MNVKISVTIFTSVNAADVADELYSDCSDGDIREVLRDRLPTIDAHGRIPSANSSLTAATRAVRVVLDRREASRLRRVDRAREQAAFWLDLKAEQFARMGTVDEPMPESGHHPGEFADVMPDARLLAEVTADTIEDKLGIHSCAEHYAEAAAMLRDGWVPDEDCFPSREVELRRAREESERKARVNRSYLEIIRQMPSQPPPRAA